MWFLTNHPWIVVFLVKPSDGFRHAHLVMILYNMILAELCFFIIFFGHDDANSSGQVTTTRRRKPSRHSILLARR